MTDRDTIVATAGGAKKDYYGKAISPQLEHLIQERESLQASAIERKLISFGTTTLPRSSIRRTIPVAFISSSSNVLKYDVDSDFNRSSASSICKN